MSAGTETIEIDEAAAQTIAERFLIGGALRVIPSKRKMKLVIFAHLAAAFEVGRRYPESEVNAILRAVHPDVATLRRGLYDEYFVDRADGYYWRTPGKERLRIKLPSPPG